MKSKSIFYIGSLIFLNFIISEAYGYLDAGSGSVILQMIIGALVAFAITLRVYWYKLKAKFARSQKRT